MVCLFFQPKNIESIGAFVLIAARLVFAVTLIPGFASNLLRQTQTCSYANVHSRDSENEIYAAATSRGTVGSRPPVSDSRYSGALPLGDCASAAFRLSAVQLLQFTAIEVRALETESTHHKHRMPRPTTLPYKYCDTPRSYTRSGRATW